jgi:phenylacetate-coenzyme A ligase PaaK-like adenylate-forming protein
MNLNQLKKLYTVSPKFVKQLYALIPYDARNGKEYRKWKRFLANPPADTKSYQMQKLKETLVYAYENVPFYKELYDGAGIDVK